MFTLASCSLTNDKENIKFSMSYFKDLQEAETIFSVSKKIFSPLKSPRMGFENGTYWFKIMLLENQTKDNIVFDLPEASIDIITVYNNFTIVPYKELVNTHKSLLITTNPSNNIYYLKVHFAKEVFFPLSLKKYTYSQLNEKYVFFVNGVYYGFALMVLIVNVFFYFSIKDKTFLFYCFFLISITLALLDYDGVLKNVIPINLSLYGSIIIHYLIPVFGAIFANQFLNIKYYLPKSNKMGLYLLAAAFINYLVFLIYKNYIFVAIADTFSLLVLLHYWIIAVVILKKHQFAKFFVIGYSLVLFSAFLYVIPLAWGLNTFFATLQSIKFGALFEMLILTYAITYRVQILQTENSRIKQQIKNYLDQIEKLETNNSTEKKFEALIKKNNLSEREADVLQLIFKGYNNQKISDELFISLNTVKYHIRNIYEKLNINSKNEVINLISTIK